MVQGYLGHASIQMTLDVLNEYNTHKHILDKYLRIYQVVENYMYKAQICDFCERVGYSKISVRDFKAMSDRLANTEVESLNKFLAESGDINISGTPLKERLNENWNNIIQSNADMKNAVENLVKKLNIRNSKGTELIKITTGTVEDSLRIFGRLVYSVRCSVVHNKVNEYHITYTNLDDDTKNVMERFLMPCMEMVVYGLMMNENSVVMYTQQSINLY